MSLDPSFFVHCETDPSARSLRTSLKGSEAAQCASFLFSHGPKGLAQQNPRLLDSPQSIAPWQLISMCRFIHELDHLHRFIYTPYGHLVHRLRSGEIESFLKGLAETDSPEFRSCANALLALGGAYTQDAIPNKFVAKPLDDLASIHFSSSDATELDPSLVPFFDSEQPAPVVDGYPLGGKALLELLGFNREITVARYVGQYYDDWMSMLDPKVGWMEDYNRAQTAWRKIVSEPLVKPPRQNENWRSANVGSSRKVLPLEIYLAADLALWLPFFPPTSSRSSQLFQWTDVQPGWRFLRIVSWLNRNARPFFSHDEFPGSFEAAYEPLIDKICDNFEWPSPRELGEEWVKWSHSCFKNKTTKGFFVEQDSSRLKAIGELTRTWMRSPCSFSLTLPEFGTREHLWFSLIEAAEGARLDSCTGEAATQLPTIYAINKAHELLTAGDFRKGAPNHQNLLRAIIKYANKNLGIRSAHLNRLLA